MLGQLIVTRENGLRQAPAAKVCQVITVRLPRSLQHYGVHKNTGCHVYLTKEGA